MCYSIVKNFMRFYEILVKLTILDDLFRFLSDFCKNSMFFKYFIYIRLKKHD